MIRVYRFHDRVAMTPPDGPTFYVNPNQARRLAEALTTYLLDIEAQRFFDSTLGETELGTTP